MRHSIFQYILLGILTLTAAFAFAQSTVVSIDADRILLDGNEMKALQRRRMVAIVSCLYWGTSRASAAPLQRSAAILIWVHRKTKMPPGISILTPSSRMPASAGGLIM